MPLSLATRETFPPAGHCRVSVSLPTLAVFWVPLVVAVLLGVGDVSVWLRFASPWIGGAQRLCPRGALSLGAVLWRGGLDWW